ncbi:manganese efflux pump MntP family protein [Haemophilus haemolyticus]|uniref:manganese efflux pump MntP n=1 Tax=Haemophilus haemolyticus TaxID=726 RepID=UPI00025E6616|nr:manganese efflux pump MntP family protein [Haemophilus haemolyticus]EIJ73842.1 PF02659 domain protein [Haemophilus haemolyticus HK386]OBX38580.1 hypothetical protein A8M50_07210 [Haemophilus haemolyticus]
MSFYTLCIIALGLSMDAFAVSISKGIALRSFRWKQALYISLCFGFFQGIMPAIGFFVGLQFSSMIQDWDHWIGFVLLALIGINMVREGLNADSEASVEPSINLKRLLTLGLATSVDALAIGISFAFLSVDIFSAMVIIALTTFIVSLFGVKSGHFLGQKFRSKAEILGGIVLIGIGISLLYEHGVFTF